MKNLLKNTTEVVPGNVTLRNVPGIVNNPRKVPSIGLKSSVLKSEDSSFDINHITNAGLSANKMNNNINNNSNISSSNNNINSNSNNISNVDQTNSATYVNKLPSSASGGGGGVSTANGRPSLPQVNIQHSYCLQFIFFCYYCKCFNCYCCYY